ncbi:MULTISPECIES: YccS family putative transporter [unclassified Avibacterium]|uniref:YccS family putative transporter n=1 Tax=unclassified Avibacterium TaxID=2685287 RepID=UPI0020265881|nr:MULTISPECIES: YccS family putative transporter [unclassified Avibacterium]MCW9698122.1 YccS family putative transporter [Avibacterium sp. 20-129]MCW9733770.1 YccS family putative transporter [Avibacterium sp. 20-15]URL05528.1 YccS family putative transporter [Avibacterium sp. 20-132]URL07611.1 YccS family putative transporter [Avibacterium sp. 21-595]
MNNWLNAKVIATIPVFIAVNIAAFSVWLFDISQQSMPLVLGIIAGGLADLDNRLTGRLKNIFYTLLAFSVSTLSVQLTLGNGVAFTLLMTVITFIFTMIGAVGQRYNTISFGTLVVALYTTLTYQPETLWYLNSLLILLGTLLYSITAIIVYLFFPNRPVQDAVAKSFLALAEYLEAKSLFFDPDDIDQLESKQITLAMKNSQLINAFNACRTALFYRIRGQYRHTRTTQMINYYFAAQDIHERANSSYFNYQVLAQQLKNTDLIFRIQRLLELQAQACRDFAQSLQQNSHYRYNPRLERAIAGVNQSFEHYAQQHQDDTQNTAIKTLINNLQGVDWQLRHLGQAPESSETHHRWVKIHDDSDVTGLKNIWLTIRSHLSFDSQLFRHAVRLSIVVFVCCTIVEFLQLSRGYWILLTAVFVCQPNYAATKLRLKQRIIGTILGVIIGSLLPYAHPTLALQMGLVVATSTLFFFFRSNNYSFSTFFITLQVLISFNIIGFDIHSALYSRLIDTLAGAFIAWIAVSYLWPDWKYLQLSQVIHKAIQSDGKYLLYIISQLQFGKCDNLQYRIARRKAHEYATALSATMSNMNSDPEKYKDHLQEGFEMLKLNYSLLSYISALGAYRKHIKQIQQNIDFMAEYYPIAKKLIYALEHIESLSQPVFDKLQKNIHQSLQQLNEQQGEKLSQSEVGIPIQQLNMISQILPHIYVIFHNRKYAQAH